MTFRVKTQSPTRISTLLDLRSQVKPPSTKVVILFSFNSGHTAHTAHTISQVLVPDGFGIQLGDSPLFGLLKHRPKLSSSPSVKYFPEVVQVGPLYQEGKKSPQLLYIYIDIMYIL